MIRAFPPLDTLAVIVDGVLHLPLLGFVVRRRIVLLSLRPRQGRVSRGNVQCVGNVHESGCVTHVSCCD